MIKKIFSERLRGAVEALGMRTADLARSVGVSSPMASYYLDASNEKLPSVETLVRLSRALGVSTDYLIGLDDAISSPPLLPRDYIRVTPEESALLEAVDGLSRARVQQVLEYIAFIRQQDGLPPVEHTHAKKALPRERPFEAIIADPQEPVPQEDEPSRPQPDPGTAAPHREADSPPTRGSRDTR